MMLPQPRIAMNGWHDQVANPSLRRNVFVLGEGIIGSQIVLSCAMDANC